MTKIINFIVVVLVIVPVLAMSVCLVRQKKAFAGKMYWTDAVG